MTKLSDRLRHSALRLTAIATLAWLCTAASCADISTPSSAKSCVVDVECVGSEVCFDGACLQTCATDADCPGGICRSELRAGEDDVVDVCALDDAANSTLAMECRFDGDCTTIFPDTDARCGIDGTCFIPAFSLLIRDTTLASGAEDGGRGADIAAIYLANDSGQPVAWADTVALNPANDVATTNTPDGTSVSLNAEGTCADAAYEAVATPLGGQDGTLLVQFLETSTSKVVGTPPSTWNVVIVEWGANCPSGELGEPDSFDVFSCVATNHKSTDPDRDCGELRGTAPAGGYVVLDAAEK